MNSPEQYQAKAFEARGRAAASTDPDAAGAWKSIARQYDRLADLAEREFESKRGAATLNR